VSYMDFSPVRTAYCSRFLSFICPFIFPFIGSRLPALAGKASDTVNVSHLYTVFTQQIYLFGVYTQRNVSLTVLERF
jgi:hypothetical protein